MRLTKKKYNRKKNKKGGAAFSRGRFSGKSYNMKRNQVAPQQAQQQVQQQQIVAPRPQQMAAPRAQQMAAPRAQQMAAPIAAKAPPRRQTKKKFTKGRFSVETVPNSNLVTHPPPQAQQQMATPRAQQMAAPRVAVPAQPQRQPIVRHSRKGRFAVKTFHSPSNSNLVTHPPPHAQQQMAAPMAAAPKAQQPALVPRISVSNNTHTPETPINYDPGRLSVNETTRFRTQPKLLSEKKAHPLSVTITQLDRTMSNNDIKMLEMGNLNKESLNFQFILSQEEMNPEDINKLSIDIYNMMWPNYRNLFIKYNKSSKAKRSRYKVYNINESHNDVNLLIDNINRILNMIMEEISRTQITHRINLNNINFSRRFKIEKYEFIINIKYLSSNDKYNSNKLQELSKMAEQKGMSGLELKFK